MEIKVYPVPDSVARMHELIERATAGIHKAAGISWEIISEDLRDHGVHITKDGKRIEPADFYLQPPETGGATTSRQ